MLPRIRREIHPPEHSHFSFVNKLSCSTSLGWLAGFCLLSHSISLMPSEILPWSFSECLPGLYFGKKTQKYKMPKYNKTNTKLLKSSLKGRYLSLLQRFNSVIQKTVSMISDQVLSPA